MIKSRRLAAKLAPAAILAGLVMGSATPAGAVTLATDRPKITAQELDFGNNWVVNAPVNGGYLYWNFNNGIVTPRLTGKIYINNASGTCARMQLQYFDGSTKLATKNGGTVCAPNGALNTWNVDMAPYSSALTDKVKVVLQVKTGSTWSNVGTDTEYL